MKRSIILSCLLSLSLVIAAAAAQLPPMHRGVNTFPWIYRARIVGNNGQAFDYARLFPYFDAFKPTHFAALRAAGFDFVRAIVEPSPFLAADSAQREALVAQVLAETRKATDQGLTVIIDPHPHEGVKAWDSLAILTSDDMKARYEAMIVAFARALPRDGHGRYVLELMNEPPGGYGWRDNYGWREFQIRLVKAARAVAPQLPLVVTGDRGGGLDGLLRLDVAAIDDPAIIYSFHYYLPMVVTHQGAKWTSKGWRQQLNGIPYPPTPSAAAPTLARAHDAIIGANAGADSGRQKSWDEAQAALLDYFHNQNMAETIQADFARVSAWARENRIPSSRILLGEFGVFRPGARVDTAVNWTRDVRKACESNGFAWAYFNYAPFDENGQGFSLLQMTGPQPNSFDPRMLSDGLGLRMP